MCGNACSRPTSRSPGNGAMAAETLSCPYCNSTVRVVRPGGTGQRLQCPRCHEMFLYRAGSDGAPDQYEVRPLDTIEQAAAGSEHLEHPPAKRWSNRSVGLVILSIMVAMAALGLAYALYTKEVRRQRDHLGALSAETSPQNIVQKPENLAALGYLPAETDAIAGIHVAALMAQPSMQPVLQLLRSNRAEFGIARLEQLTGLKLEDLDEVVLSLKMQEDVIPQIILIARTRRPYDPEAVRAKLKAKRAIELQGKRVYRFTPEQLQLVGALWCADERTLVFGLHPNDLIDLPTAPIVDVERFPEQIRKYLTRLGPGSQAWVVGAPSQWEKLLGLLHLLGLGEADRRIFSQVRAFCCVMSCWDKVGGDFTIQCIDRAGAEAFDKYLDSKGLDPSHLRSMAAKEPRAAALLQELADSLVRTHPGENVRMQFSISTVSIRQALARAAGLERAVK